MSQDDLTLNSFVKSPSGSTISYFWDVSIKNKTDEVHESISRDSSKFVLASNTLTSDSTYKVELTAMDDDSKLSSTDQIFVIVRPARIIPRIVGGSVQTVPIASGLLLDASYSYSEWTGSALGLSFVWNLVQVLPDFAEICPVNYQLEAGGSLLRILPSTTSISTQCKATVYVSGMKQTESSSVSLSFKSDSTLLQVNSDVADYRVDDSGRIVINPGQKV